MLETGALGKRYGGACALRDCSLHLPAGRVAALVGPNGAGKTTLMHLAVGLPCRCGADRPGDTHLRAFRAGQLSGRPRRRPDDPRQSEAAAHCQALSHQFQRQYSGLAFVAILFVILPVFVGLFFGAPLVAREVEQGTHRLVWTQGVSRRRWALTKFGLVGGVTVVLALLYAVGVSWWFGPLVTATSSHPGPRSARARRPAVVVASRPAPTTGSFTSPAAGSGSSRPSRPASSSR